MRRRHLSRNSNKVREAFGRCAGPMGPFVFEKLKEDNKWSIKSIYCPREIVVSNKNEPETGV